jgi:hypothetical protein
MSQKWYCVFGLLVSTGICEGGDVPDIGAFLIHVSKNYKNTYIRLKKSERDKLKIK